MAQPRATRERRPIPRARQLASFGTDTVLEFTLSTPAAPGVTHRWTRIADYMEEPSNARIWAGIHYRFSTKGAATWGAPSARTSSRTRYSQ